MAGVAELWWPQSVLLRWQVGRVGGEVCRTFYLADEHGRCIAGPSIDLHFQLCAWGSMLVLHPQVWTGSISILDTIDSE